MEGGEAGGIADCVAVQQGCEDCFEAGWVRPGETGVDVGGRIEIGLQRWSLD